MKKLFAPKEIFKVKSRPVDPAEMGEPVTVDEFTRRGMAYYARQQYPQAEVDFSHALLLDRANVDAYYGLGMVCKAMGRKPEASEAFSHVLDLLSKDTSGNSTKSDMLRRLALGHINMINQGDWNLEKVIWKRIA